jgi:hypothetical protein
VPGAGQLDEETRAAHVAGDGLVDEGVGDAVGLVVEDDVDGVAQARGAQAGRDLAAAAGRSCFVRSGFAAGFSTPVAWTCRRGPRFATPAAWTCRRGPRFATPAAWTLRRGPRIAGCSGFVTRVFGFAAHASLAFASFPECPRRRVPGLKAAM